MRTFAIILALAAQPALAHGDSVHVHEHGSGSGANAILKIAAAALAANLILKLEW